MQRVVRSWAELREAERAAWAAPELTKMDDQSDRGEPVNRRQGLAGSGK